MILASLALWMRMVASQKLVAEPHGMLSYRFPGKPALSIDLDSCHDVRVDPWGGIDPGIWGPQRYFAWERWCDGLNGEQVLIVSWRREVEP